MIRQVAILGAGIGAEHLAGYAALPDRYAVRWVCDLDAARGQALATDAADAQWTGDLEEVLADAAVDLIDICLPPHLHLDVACKALRAGKDVICEKPLVASLAEVDHLAAAMDETGGQVFPVFQYRYGPGMSALRALVAAGLAGRPLVAALETHWSRDAAYYAVPWRGTWAGERGGAVLGHAIHAHDLLTSTFGPVNRVSAELATRVNPIEVEDCAALSFRHESGAVSSSSITLGAAKDTTRLRFVFEHLTAESGDLPYRPAEGVWQFQARDPARQSEIDAVVSSLPPTPSGYAGLFTAIANSLDGQPSDAVTFEDGRQSIALVTAIYHAARSDGRVTLPLPRDHPLYEDWAP